MGAPLVNNGQQGPPLDRPGESWEAARAEGAYFDQLVRDEGEFNPFTERGWGTLAKQFERMVHPETKLRMLDVGCGTGQSRRIYEKHVGAYVGIDLSLGALRRARSNYPGTLPVKG